MENFLTGKIIKELRQKKGLTQKELAEKLEVSDKAISKWETNRGYPDITLLESLAFTLGISVAELLTGTNSVNNNRSANMRKTLFYVCPLCGNIFHSTGQGFISCCGISLLPLEAEEPDKKEQAFEETSEENSSYQDGPSFDESHVLHVERIEDEYFVTTTHPMTKTHYLSFIASVCDNSVTITKLYPESTVEARFKIRQTNELYYFCNHHGLYKLRMK